jgi:hypothetical protein
MSLGNIQTDTAGSPLSIQGGSYWFWYFFTSPGFRAR